MKTAKKVFTIALFTLLVSTTAFAAPKGTVAKADAGWTDRSRAARRGRLPP